MYKVIGTDGQHYGPATADQIRQWIRENRVERQTPMFVEGAADWTFAGLHPEFANDFREPGQPPVVPIPPHLIAPIAPPRQSAMAKLGLIFGILSLTICCCCGGLPFNVPGLIFSIIALVQIRENPHLYDGQEIAILGLVFSALSLMILMVSMIFK